MDQVALDEVGFRGGGHGKSGRAGWDDSLVEVFDDGAEARLAEQLDAEIGRTEDRKRRLEQLAHFHPAAGDTPVLEQAEIPHNSTRAARS